MPLSVPPFLPAAQLEATPPVHAWDDDDPYSVLGMPDEALEEALSDVTDRAKKAFTIAVAEWIIRRFGALSKDPLPLQYVEASWVGLTDWTLAYQWEPDSRAFQGPVRGPLDLAVKGITNCHYSLGLGGGEDDAAFASMLAVHVMPDPAPFLSWQGRAVDRLRKLYPRDDDEPLGPPVPREALDPAVPLSDLTPERCGELVRDFLRRVDPRNPFIVPPDKRDTGGP